MIMMMRGLERESLLDSMHWKSNALNKWVCLIQNPNSIFCTYLGGMQKKSWKFWALEIADVVILKQKRVNLLLVMHLQI
jgi:hypothetical protein